MQQSWQHLVIVPQQHHVANLELLPGVSSHHAVSGVHWPQSTTPNDRHDDVTDCGAAVDVSGPRRTRTPSSSNVPTPVSEAPCVGGYESELVLRERWAAVLGAREGDFRVFGNDDGLRACAAVVRH